MKHLYHTLSHIVLPLVLVFSSLGLSACAAVQQPTSMVPEAINAVNFYDTLRGMVSAARGEPGTFVLTNGKDLVMLAWPYKGNYAFTVTSLSQGNAVKQLTEIIKNGNGASPVTMADLVKGLIGQGWAYLAAEELPASVFEVLKATSVEALTAGATRFTTFFCLPAGLLELPWETESISS